MKPILLGAILACLTGDLSGAVTNQISVHIVKENVPSQALESGRLKSDGLTIMFPPVLSDTDFLAYDPTNYMFTITANAAKQLSVRLMQRNQPVQLRSGETGYDLCWDEVPFILAVSGQPVYVGVFSCPNSSTSYLLPTVFAAVPFIRADSTNSATLWIDFNRSPALYGIDAPADARNDPRILAAFRKLGLKL